MDLEDLKFNDFNSHVSDYVYDSVKKTLYSINTDQNTMQKIQTDLKIESVVPLPTGFPLNGHQSEDGIIKSEEKPSSTATYTVPETLRFSRRTNWEDISPSGLTVTRKEKDTSKSDENQKNNLRYSYYSNLSFKTGVHYWEIICPVSCSGIEFGVENRKTLAQFVNSFRTTTPRTVGVKLDLVSLKLEYFMNGRPQPQRTKTITQGEYYLLVNVKNWNTYFILNPFAQLSEENVVLPNTLLLSAEEKEYILSQTDLKEIAKDTENKVKEIVNSKPGDDVPEEGSPQKVKNFKEKQGTDDQDSSEIVIESSKDAIEGSLDLAQNLEKVAQIFVEIDQLESCSEEGKNDGSKIQLHEYTDKLFQVQGSYIKATARNSNKQFSRLPIQSDKLPDNKNVQIQVIKDDLKLLISSMNWKILETRHEHETRVLVNDFLKSFTDAKVYQDNGQLVLFTSFDYLEARIASDAILSSISYMLETVKVDFQNAKHVAIAGLKAVELNSNELPKGDERQYIFDQKPSMINLLKCISIWLSIEEQLWINSKRFTNKFDVAKIHKIWARVQSSYGRLASYISWSSNKAHPVLLSEAGLVNISDKLPKLSHYLEYGSVIEEDILHWIYQDSKALSHYLESKFTNNLMIKGFESINVPLYKTLNYHPASCHTSLMYSKSSGWIEPIQSMITHLLTTSNSEFIATASNNDGSLCIWNSVLQLFLVGRISFKSDVMQNKEIDILQQKIKHIQSQMKAKEDEEDIVEFKVKSTTGISYEYASENEDVVESLKDIDLLKELPGLPLSPTLSAANSFQSVTNNTVASEPAIVPDPKFLEDLINMGFNKEESEQALIDVKNESIDLAIDKVFENKNKLEDQNSNLQSVIEASLTETSGTNDAESQKAQEEAKKLEEQKIKEQQELERQNKIQQYKLEKQKEIDDIEVKINNLNEQIKAIKNTQIKGLLMCTWTEPSNIPLVFGWTIKQDDKFYLQLKSVWYYNKYLEKVVENTKDASYWLLDDYCVTKNSSDDSDINTHILRNYKFSINTLIPLFIGYQTRK